MDMEMIYQLVAQQEPQTLAAAALAGSLGAVLAGVTLVRAIKMRRGRKMATLADKYIYSNIITDALEEAVHNGIISRQKANYWYRQNGYYLKVDDCLPRNPDQWYKTKARIKRERQLRHALTVAGQIKQPKIPGPMPIQSADLHANVWPTKSRKFDLRKKAAA